MARTTSYAENPKAIKRTCLYRSNAGAEITEEIARAICGQWHDGQTSAMYAFSSSGHYDREGLLVELSNCYNDPANIHDLPLNMLGTYLLNRK